MSILEPLVQAIQILSALLIIFLVLMQQGKGADLGASFGGGASGSIFGAAGSSNFMSRLTAISVTIFFITSMALAYFAVTDAAARGEATQMEAAPTQTVPTAVEGAEGEADGALPLAIKEEGEIPQEGGVLIPAPTEEATAPATGADAIPD